MPEELHKLAECMNKTHYKNYGKKWLNVTFGNAAFDFAQAATDSFSQTAAVDVGKEVVRGGWA